MDKGNEQSRGVAASRRPAAPSGIRPTMCVATMGPERSGSGSD